MSRKQERYSSSTDGGATSGAAAEGRSGFRWAVTAITGALAVTALAACGSAAADSGKPAAPAVKAQDLMIASTDLAEGWRDSNSQGTDYRVTVCGVDIEPDAPLDKGNQRFSQSAFGPFVEQHVRVYSGDTAQRVIDQLKAALPTCAETTVPRSTGSKETVQIAIEPIEVPGGGQTVVAWRQKALTEQPVVSEVLLTRVGSSAVLFTSYALKADPDPQVLLDALAATRAKG